MYNSGMFALPQHTYFFLMAQLLQKTMYGLPFCNDCCSQPEQIRETPLGMQVVWSQLYMGLRTEVEKMQFLSNYSRL